MTAVPLLADGQRHKNQIPFVLSSAQRRCWKSACVWCWRKPPLGATRAGKPPWHGQGERGEGCMRTGRSRVSCRGMGASTKAKSESQEGLAQFAIFFFLNIHTALCFFLMKKSQLWPERHQVVSAGENKGSPAAPGCQPWCSSCPPPPCRMPALAFAQSQLTAETRWDLGAKLMMGTLP